MKMGAATLLKLIIFIITSSETHKHLMMGAAHSGLNSHEQFASNETVAQKETPSSPATSTSIGSGDNNSNGGGGGGGSAYFGGKGSSVVLVEERDQSRQRDQQSLAAAQATTTSVRHHHPNHQNHHYPVEPYPSASYTSLLASSTSAQQFPPSNHQQQQQHHISSLPQLNSLLNRDHHHSSSIGLVTGGGGGGSQNDIFGNDNTFSSSSSLAPGARGLTAAEPMAESQLNLNYGISNGTIQNLTAGLFPVSKQQPLLFNSTLQALSELLSPANRTRQSSGVFGTSYFNNAYRPSFSGANSAGGLSYQHNQLANQPNHQPMASTHTSGGGPSNFLDPMSLSGVAAEQQQYSVFDLLRPEQQQFGFREMGSGSHRSYHNQPGQLSPAPSLSLFKPVNAANGGHVQASTTRGTTTSYNAFNHHHHHPSYTTSIHDNIHSPSAKTSSNIYNTYMRPYYKASDSLSSLPTMTNGQALNMAALFDDYHQTMDPHNNYNRVYQKLLMGGGGGGGKGSSGGSQYNPSTADHHHHQLQRPSAAMGNYHIDSGSAGGGGPSSGSYQYIQHNNFNNQNHLDKIIYHSTPFRPSIVSPPSLSSSSMAQQSSAGNQGASATSGSSSQQQQQQQQQRAPKSADNDGNKSTAFASLGSPSSAISDSKSDYKTNINGQQQVNSHHSGSKYSSSDLGSSSRQQQQQQSAGKLTDDSKDSPGGGLTSSMMSNTNEEPYEPFERFRNSSHHSQGSGGGQNNSTTSTDEYPDIRPPNERQAPQSSSNKTTTTTSSALVGAPNGPAMLFDLYEREIDNQIREALYNEHPNLEPLLNSMTRGPWQFDKPSAAFYEDAPQPPITTADQTMASWARPVALGSHNIYTSPPPSTSGRARPLGQATTDPLTAALQELPTFSASDLQPLFPPAGPTYSLLNGATPSALAQDSFPEVSIASLASQLFPLINQNSGGGGQQQHATGGLGNMIAEAENGIGYSGTGYKLTTKPTAAASAVPSGLPAILFRLHSSPLSSILANPLTHLYSSLPRYRNNKKQQHQQQQSSSTSNQLSQLITSPSSLFAHHSLGGSSSVAGNSAAGKQQLHKGATKSNNHHHQNRHHQSAMAAAAAADLLAAASLPLSPLQAALLQAQAGSMSAAYLGGNQLEPELSALFGSQAGAQHQPTAAFSGSANAGAAYDSQGHGQQNVGSPFRLASGGISPLIWRSIFSPANWARKQSAAATTTTLTTSTAAAAAANSIGQTHQQAVATATNLTSSLLSPLSPSFPFNAAAAATTTSSFPSAFPQASPLSLAHYGSQQHKSNEYGNFMSALLGDAGGGGGGNFAAHLFQPATSASSSVQTATSANNHHASTQHQQQQQPKRPRLKIKILKIPVAFYDQPSGVGGPTSAAAIGLVPAQMQALLAGLPCPLHPYHQAGSSGGQLSHPSLEQYLVSNSQSPTAAAALAALGAFNHPNSGSNVGGATLASGSTAGASSAAASSIESPVSIQGFTDINQPNDLQVSPTGTTAVAAAAASLQGKLLKVL